MSLQALGAFDRFRSRRGLMTSHAYYSTAQQQWLTGYNQLAGRSIQERSFRSSTSTIHAKHMRCAPQCVYTATMRIIDIIITPYLRCICRSHHPHIYTAFVMAKLDLSGKCMRDMLSGRLHYLEHTR
jgi:hypothetical protein